MNAPALELLAPLRLALIATTAITGKLGKFEEQPSVHTRRPVPVSATYPMIVVGPLITRTDNDLINGWRPKIVLDITVYGEPAHYRDVEALGDVIYRMFHRYPRAIAVANYSVTQITCAGPTPAAADTDARVARRVTLTIDLHAK